MTRYVILILALLLSLEMQGQADEKQLLPFEEYLAYVKKFHPVARQAELTITASQGALLRARGGFDPSLEVDYERKEFKGSPYYDRLNATFKIPTWYGVELKGNFEQNEGDFLNPSETVPTDGLFSAGLSLSVGQGLWINERMVTLKQAKLFREQANADRDLLVNEILFQASVAYFDWLQAYQEQEIFRDFLENAEIRLEGVRKSALAGDIAAIDTVEASIAVQNRALSLEQARVTLNYKALALSTYLWIEGDIPVELRPGVIPETNLDTVIDAALEIAGKPLDSFSLENHPKLRSLNYKIDALELEKRLKANQLLPQISLEYNFLTETPDRINSFEAQAYKGGLAFRMPLFLRKERGELELARVKLQDARFEQDNAEVQLRNKILAIYGELESFGAQNQLIEAIVGNYSTLLSAEERKFSFGESSLFLINSRENALIDARLKQNKVQNSFYTAKAKLFNSLALNPIAL